jgi:hypothetical protein
MASLVVLLIALGCAALQFFKGTFVKAFVAIIIAIISGIVSFAFFESAANMIISRGDGGTLLSIAPWAQTLCFILIYIVVFALLQTGAIYLLHEKIVFGELPEYIGRAVCGLILGFIISGFLLTALAMGPLPLNYPYQRFDPRSVDPDDPKGVLFNADGFATGLFSIVSKGSLSGKRSFAAVHPDYLNQLFFNRLIETDSISIISYTFPAITVSREAAVWDAPKAISDQANALIGELRTGGGRIKTADNKTVSLPVSTDSGDIKIVRVGILRKALKGNSKINGAAFTLSQLRLICTRRGSSQDRLAGDAINVYPIGHLRSADQIQVASEVRVMIEGFGNGERFIDFVFNVPSGYDPVLVEYKLNSIVEIAQTAVVTDPANIPAPATFDATSSGGAGNRNRNRPNRNRRSPSSQQESSTESTSDSSSGLSDTSRSIVGPALDDN